MRLFRNITLPALAATLLQQATSFAQDPGILVDGLTGCDFRTGRLTAACIPVFVGHLIQVVFSLVSVFFIVNVLFAGYQIAQGALTGSKEEGKTRLIYSIIGLVVTVCTFLLMELVITIITP